MMKRSPSAQITVGRKDELAHFSGSPSLAILKKTYGESFPSSWLLPQIFDLVVYSNSKGTLNEQQIEFLAEAIAQEYYYLTVDEFLLFFYRFKLGKYGHFYGVVDPMKITQALDEFCKERNYAIEKHDKQLEAEERDRIAENASIINCEEYCKKHGYPIMHQIHEIICYEMALEKENVKPPSH